MTATMPPVSGSRDSAKVGPVAREFSRRTGLTPGSAHQHINRIHRELPVLVEAAVAIDRAAWLDWFFATLDLARSSVGGCELTPEMLMGKGAADRTEDSAREAYMMNASDAHARELDARLEKEWLHILRLRRALRATHRGAFA